MANPSLSPGIVSPQSIYETHSVTHASGEKAEGQHPVGTRAYLPDGRVYYYSSSNTSAAAAVGKLYMSPTVVANHTECDVTTGNAGTYVVSGITIGATAMTQNQYRNGYLAVTDGAGEGHVYRIASHAAFDASATTVSVTLYDPIVVALDTNSTVSFIANQYDRIVIGDTGQAGIPVGVPPVTIPVSTTTTTYFGWVQTWGLAAVLQDENIAAAAQAVTVGTGVAGAVEEDDTATTVSQEFIVGYSASIAVDTEYGPVFLRINP